MTALTSIPIIHPAMETALARRLERVVGRIGHQMTSSIPEVDELCRHVERYRGKMLRPVLTLLCADASVGRAGPDFELSGVEEELVTVASVVEMIHLATLVHDDVLDDAETRRGAPTIARMRSGEVAVILGDFLLSQAYHLCSTLSDQTTALRVGEVTSAVCEGEMLQLIRRGKADLDERTYFTIVERKTAALIAVACELGAKHAGADPELARRFYDFGRDLGIAFQIQDDLLDLVGDERVVGKTLGKDIEMGKVTLPVLHHLSHCDPSERANLTTLIRAQVPLNGERRGIVERLHATGSVDYARSKASDLVEQAKARLMALPASVSRDQLLLMADQVVRREA
ncbi:MAG: polyprenyl synthetase family protein [Phycisphaerales bacterium]